MREILFRGKRISGGEWLYGSLLTDNRGQKHIIPFKEIYMDGHHVCIESDWPQFFDQQTIGQYTGLLDKHGRKIFEGDIVVTCPSPLSISDGGDISKRLVVNSWVFTDMCHSAMCKKSSKREKFYKIVGNIHDNPDLMKEIIK